MLSKKNGMQIHPIYLAIHINMEENSSRIDITFLKQLTLVDSLEINPKG